jgi:hypothetical protein
MNHHDGRKRSVSFRDIRVEQQLAASRFTVLNVASRFVFESLGGLIGLQNG